MINAPDYTFLIGELVGLYEVASKYVTNPDVKKHWLKRADELKQIEVHDLDPGQISDHIKTAQRLPESTLYRYRKELS